MHLRELHIDELKIDRSFVMRLSEDERNAAITHSIVDLGHRLGLNVVAEGVQTEAAWTRLAEWGRRGAGPSARPSDDGVSGVVEGGAGGGDRGRPCANVERILRGVRRLARRRREGERAT